MSNSTSIFLHRIFKGFADAIIKVFVPLLIFKATNNLFFSITYCVISYLLAALLFVCMKKIVAKYPILCIILHIIPIILSQLLFIIEFQFWMIFVLAIADAMGSVLYFGGLNFIFGFIDNKNDTAKFETGQNIGVIFFTLLSAFLIGNIVNSLVFLFVASSVMYFISILFLIVKYKNFTKETKQLEFHKMLDSISKSKKFNFYHFFCGGVDIVIGTFIPLYLYSSGLSFTATGILLSIKQILKILANYFAKFTINRKFCKFFIILTASLSSLAIITIIFLKNIYVIFALTLLLSFDFQFIFVILFQHFVQEQKSLGYYQDAVFYRDLFQNSARSSMGLLYLIIPIFPVLFSFGAMFTLAMGLSGAKAIK